MNHVNDEYALYIIQDECRDVRYSTIINLSGEGEDLIFIGSPLYKRLIDQFNTPHARNYDLKGINNY